MSAHGKRDGVALVETARLEESAGAREVLCTGAFRTLAEEVAPGLFRHPADVVLRGLGHTTDVWEFDWRRAGRSPERLPLPFRLAVDEPHLVGRSNELSKLDQIWRREEPDVGLSLIGGEAGIGKSALVRSFAQVISERGSSVLYGRCDPQALTPFEPFAEAYATFREQTDTSPQLLSKHAQHLDGRMGNSMPADALVDDANLEAFRYGLFDAVVDWLIDFIA